MNILVVEDDCDIREMVCQSLAQNDYRTVGCRDVQEAKQSIARHNPDCLSRWAWRQNEDRQSRY